MGRNSDQRQVEHMVSISDNNLLVRLWNAPRKQPWNAAIFDQTTIREARGAVGQLPHKWVGFVNRLLRTWM